MTARGAVALAGLVAALAAPAAARAGDAPPIVRPIGEARLRDRDLGAQLYAANCATCHGTRGQGVVPGTSRRGVSGIDGAGPPLTTAGALAADFYLTTGSMPLEDPFDQPERHRPWFNRREIRALTDYVAGLGTGPPVPQPRPGQGDVARGQELFTSHCAGCHQVVGEGGVVTGARVPPLDRASATQIAEAVRIGPYVMPRFSDKAISRRELDDLVSYVLYAQHPRDVGGWDIDHLGPFPEGIVAWAVAIIVLAGTCVLIGSRLRRRPEPLPAGERALGDGEP